MNEQNGVDGTYKPTGYEGHTPDPWSEGPGDPGECSIYGADGSYIASVSLLNPTTIALVKDAPKLARSHAALTAKLEALRERHEALLLQVRRALHAHDPDRTLAILTDAWASHLGQGQKQARPDTPAESACRRLVDAYDPKEPHTLSWEWLGDAHHLALEALGTRKDAL